MQTLRVAVIDGESGVFTKGYSCVLLYFREKIEKRKSCVAVLKLLLQDI